MRHRHPIAEPTATEVPADDVIEADRVTEAAEVMEAVAEPPAPPAPKPAPPRAKPHAPSPYDLAGLSGAFAMTANVADPEPETEPAEQPAYAPPHHPLGNHDNEDMVTERGLRGLVGGGASQVSVAAALRARDAARPTDADLAAADQDLVIVRRGWVPREELPRPGRR
jgi:hypothetical protein